MKRNLTIPSQDLKRRKLTTLAPPAHYGVIVNKVKNNYMGVYFCDGKMRYVTEGTIYESIVNAVRNDADKMRKMGCSVAVNVGHERKPIIEKKQSKPPPLESHVLPPPLHFGIVLNRIRNTYTGMYACDGKMRFVTEGQFYDRVLAAVKHDAAKMKSENHTVDDNVGKPRPIPPKPEPVAPVEKVGKKKQTRRKRPNFVPANKGKRMPRQWSRRKIERSDPDLPPANHWGIHLDRVKQRYLGRYTCNGKMRYVTSGVDYKFVLKAVLRDAAMMREEGHNVSTKVGTWKMIRPDGHLPYPEHVGIIYDKQNKIYRGMYVCDGVERRVDRGRNYGKVLEALKCDVAKMRAEGREVSEWIGRPKKERREAMKCQRETKKEVKKFPTFSDDGGTFF